MVCPKCDEHAEAVKLINAEPKRIIAFCAWYETKKFIASELRGDNLWDAWAAMPDDGFLRCRLYYNHFNIGRDGKPNVRLAGELVGSDWYWMFRAPDGEISIAQDKNICDTAEASRRQIASRYPGASIKRGKWTSPATIGRVNADTFDQSFVEQSGGN